MTLEAIEPRVEPHDHGGQRRQQARRAHADVLTGAEFRKKLGWGKDRFYAAVKSGRFTHLISLNASDRRHVVYVRAMVDAWIRETPAATLRAVRAASAR